MSTRSVSTRNFRVLIGSLDTDFTILQPFSTNPTWNTAKCFELGPTGEWMNTTANDVPVFIRGGSIISMQFPLLPQGGDVDTLSNILIRKRGLRTEIIQLEYVKTVCEALVSNPYVLHIALDEFGRSDGSLFIDDGESDLEMTSGNPKITMSVSDSILSVYPSDLTEKQIPALEKIIVQPIKAQINRVSDSQIIKRSKFKRLINNRLYINRTSL